MGILGGEFERLLEAQEIFLPAAMIGMSGFYLRQKGLFDIIGGAREQDPQFDQKIRSAVGADLVVDLIGSRFVHLPVF